MTDKQMMDLPFVRVARGQKDFWVPVAETGNWGSDNKIGRTYADALVGACKAGELGMVLGHVAQAITAKQRFGGIEVGFFNRLGEIASFASAADFGHLRKAA